jgi:hypothetical protein
MPASSATALPTIVSPAKPTRRKAVRRIPLSLDNVTRFRGGRSLNALTLDTKDAETNASAFLLED